MTPRRKRAVAGEKTGNKTGSGTMRSPRSGSEIPTGAHPGNTGGKKGRSGRKPEAFKAMCQALASSKEVRANAAKILRNADHPLFIGALKWASENGYGRPAQTVDVTSGGVPLNALLVVPAETP